MRLRIHHPILAGGLLLFTSCDMGRKTTTTTNGGGIILGDSSMIVTEADSTYLQDMNVVDYNPSAPTTAEVKNAAVTKPDTVPTVVPQPEVAKEPEEPKEEPAEKPQGKGLTVENRDFTLFIPDANAKGSGTTFQLKSGSLNGKQLRITEGTVQKISQRTQSVVVVRNNLGELVLDNLSATSDWKPLKGGGNAFTISGLNSGQLNAPKVTSSSVRSAVSRAARKKRMSRSTEQKWINSVKNVRSANQKPLSLELRSVMWKIEGKTDKGKPFSRQIRMDMPL